MTLANFITFGTIPDSSDLFIKMLIGEQTRGAISFRKLELILSLPQFFFAFMEVRILSISFGSVGDR